MRTDRVAERASSGEPRRPRSASRFLALFVLYLLAGNVLMNLGAVDRWVVGPWTTLNTVWATRLSSILGFPASSAHNVMTIDTVNLDVKQGCNGFHALLIFACGVLAFPASWFRRLVGVLVGGVVVLGFNLIRLVNLLLVARYYPQSLELFHVYVWQTLIIVLAFGTFIGWGILIAPKQARTAHAFHP